VHRYYEELKWMKRWLETRGTPSTQPQ